MVTMVTMDYGDYPKMAELQLSELLQFIQKYVMASYGNNLWECPTGCNQQFNYLLYIMFAFAKGWLPIDDNIMEICLGTKPHMPTNLWGRVIGIEWGYAGQTKHTMIWGYVVFV